jgi:hypothetical protein
MLKPERLSCGSTVTVTRGWAIDGEIYRYQCLYDVDSTKAEILADCGALLIIPLSELHLVSSDGEEDQQHLG